MKPTTTSPSASAKRSATQILKTQTKSSKALPAPSAKSQKASSKPASREAKTKLSVIVAMLCDKRGADIDQLAKATGWQKHSVRGAISGVLKKRLGLKVIAESSDAGRIYRIAK